MTRFEVYSHPAALKAPYVLSFATINQFDTFYVKAEKDGKTGYGEITPLPGYSDETVAIVREALADLATAAASGKSVETALSDIRSMAPMTESGFRCALDMLELGLASLLEDASEQSVSLAALCGGEDPGQAADKARVLCKEGYKTLKLKIAADTPAADIRRISAVADAIPDDVTMRLDANQRLGENEAESFCAALEGLPIEFVEQPFAAGETTRTERLCKASPVPIMLDESIWTVDDIDTAARLGATFVKMKLCKHPGVKATEALIDHARALGLGIVFGNGVQSELGNRLEAAIHLKKNLDTASESNGFRKLRKPCFDHDMHVTEGRLFAGRLDPESPVFQVAEPLLSIEFNAI